MKEYDYEVRVRLKHNQTIQIIEEPHNKAILNRETGEVIELGMDNVDKLIIDMSMLDELVANGVITFKEKLLLIELGWGINPHISVNFQRKMFGLGLCIKPNDNQKNGYIPTLNKTI